MEKETFAQMEISTKAALHNFKYFRSYLKKETKLLILIKANSYGHGAVDFAKLMEKAGADYFAVAHPIEGIELRAGGIKTPIIVLTTGTDYYKEIIENGLEPGIPNLYSLKKFDAVVKKMGVDVYPVHIKLDTGMHRLGFMERNFLNSSSSSRPTRRSRSRASTPTLQLPTRRNGTSSPLARLPSTTRWLRR